MSVFDGGLSSREIERKTRTDMFKMNVLNENIRWMIFA